MELPSTLMGYLLLHLLPKVPFLVAAFVSWRAVESAVGDIEHGYLACQGEPCEDNMPWSRKYLRYLQRPARWNLFFRSVNLLTFALIGIAVGWVVPGEVYLPFVLPFLVIGFCVALGFVPPPERASRTRAGGLGPPSGMEPRACSG